MTEDKWRTSTKPRLMLDWLEANHLATPRKKRLFAFSACQLGWNDLRPEVQRLIEAAEDHVERPNQATDDTSGGRIHDALIALHRVTLTELESATLDLIGYTVNSMVRGTAYLAGATDLGEVAPPVALAGLLREQFGNPFRKARWVSARLQHRIDTWSDEKRPADLLLVRDWLTWGDGIVLALAGAIDEERAWDRMPILADALEDAGCDESALLDHLRQSERHARGCWVLDLILSRE